MATSAIPATLNSSTSFRLAFGVELEFVVRYDPTDYEEKLMLVSQRYDRSSSWHTLPIIARTATCVRADMIDCLRDHGLPVNDFLTARPDYTNWTVSTDGSIAPFLSEPVEDDAKAGKPYTYTGIELKTPVLPLSQASLILVQRVVRIVTTNFRTSVNRSCGLHVHVGNGPHGFTTTTVKNLATLTTLFERQFNSLHPMHRVGNTFCKSPRRLFDQTPPWQIAMELQSLNTIEAIVDRYCMSSGILDHQNAYNFNNLLYTSLKTIEFRQHEATLDPAAITTWVELACGITASSHLAGPAGFSDLCAAFLDEPSFSVVQLLRCVGLPGVGEWYGKRGLWDHGRMAWEWVDVLGEMYLATGMVLPEGSGGEEGRRMREKVFGEAGEREREVRGVVEGKVEGEGEGARGVAGGGEVRDGDEGGVR
ncbi:hypothetical protein MMC12_007005 [Toensbergia leucococca]|nr:hypothetical protein [Toensbergia leucococca]